MSDLRDLYQDVILEHSKAPRNYREQPAANHKAEGFNPLCGDHFTIFITLDGDKIQDISFQGSGCAISKASASMMTQTLKGKTKAEAEQLFTRFHDLVTGHERQFRIRQFAIHDVEIRSTDSAGGNGNAYLVTRQDARRKVDQV